MKLMNSQKQLVKVRKFLIIKQKPKLKNKQRYNISKSFQYIYKQISTIKL